MNKAKLYALAMLTAGTTIAEAQNTPVSQMEKLTRGVVVVPAASGSGQFISWRLLGTDNDATTFDILKDGKLLKTDIFDKTNFVDKTGYTNSNYQIVTKQNGVATDTTAAVTSWGNIYMQLPLDRPEGGVTPAKETYTFRHNDCSAGDVDGDGEYEIIVKWDPSNSKDNSQSGYTGNVYLDCYKLDGTKLWRIDLGKNIRAGAHYTQFMVYDFDGDGKAEMMCKTAPGSIDGAGQYVSEAADDETIKKVNNTYDWRNTSGKVKGGQEYLTVFDGYTGKAVHTVFYRPNRAPKSDATPQWGGEAKWTFNWDDRSGKTDTEYGNRGERYLAGVAYLDGPNKNPSGIFSRGYYTWAYIWAVDFDGEKLSTKWLHASVSKVKEIVYDGDGKAIHTKTHAKNTNPENKGSKTMYGNGNHNLSIADVDGDGCDEIIWGSAALNNDGKLLYATGYGHGDAIHVSDLLPDRPGLEVFQVHEDGTCGYGWDLHDAATGEVIYSATSSGDNGRGMAADIDGDHKGFEFWSGAKDGTHQAGNGTAFTTKQGSVNFRAYWDGDLQDELLDGNQMDKWNGNGTNRIYPLTGKNFYDIANSSTCNSTKKTPNLLADLFGDWREELILWDGSDAAHLNIFTTNVESSYRVPTLMHDHTYRMGIAWQNTAYNQPPHLGYYLPGSFTTRYVLTGKGAFEQTVVQGDSITTIAFRPINSGRPTLSKVILPDGTETTTAPEGFKFNASSYYTTRELSLEGKPMMIGTYEFILKSGANVVDKTTQTDTIRIYSTDPTAIESVTSNETGEWVRLTSSSSMTDDIELTFSLKKAQNVRIGIYSMAGAQVVNVNHTAVNSAPLKIFGLSRLPAGIYMLKVESGEGTFTKKLLKR